MKRKNDKKPCNVFYSELWGTRNKKYEWLGRHDFTSTKWQKITPKTEFYFFIQRDERLLKSYDKFLKITEIFPVNSVGVVTSRDEFVIDFDKKVLERRVGMLTDKKLPDEILKQAFSLKDKENWKIAKARENIRNDRDYKNAFVQILYRPFDMRWIFYHDEVVERSRKEVMRHMLNDNLAILSARSNKSPVMDHFFCSKMITETKCSESTTQSYIFPLYLYPTTVKPKTGSKFIALALFEPQAEYASRVPNIDKNLCKVLSSVYRFEPAPEQILYYVYSVLYSETYRMKYAEFLKTDFSRVPFAKDHKLFESMAEFGRQLTELHLLTSDDLDNPTAKYQGKGDNKIEKLKYDENNMRVYINAEQYFEKVEPDIWSYQIGGYQVCRKWLKDRKDRTLSLEEIKVYCRIVTALKNTIAVQKKIDAIYPSIEKDTINI